jgi:hypothetical protein
MTIDECVAKATLISGSGSANFMPMYVSPMGRMRASDRWEDDGSGQKTGVGYVLYKMSESRTKPTRVLRVAEPHASIRLGTMIWLANNGSRSGDLGQYCVVGAISYDTGEEAGTISSEKLAHSML